MKSYLRNKRRQKEKSLREISDLQNALRSLKDKSVSVDNCVKNITNGIQDGLKGDNTKKLANSSTNINKNNSRKIDESISLAAKAKSKVQDEINSIDRQIREIERQEEAERRQREEESKNKK